MKARRSSLKLKHWVMIAVFALVAIVLLQNMEVVSFRVLFWQFSMSRIIAFPLLVLAGIVIGFLLGKLSRKDASHK